MDKVEQEVRDQRAALLQAVNAKDWDAVKSILHPSFYAKGILGFKFRRGLMFAAVKLMFMTCRAFREDMRIDDLQLEGDRAELTVTRTDSMKILGVFPKKATDRYKEIWGKHEGRWLMLSEQHLESVEGPHQSLNPTGNRPAK